MVVEVRLRRSDSLNGFGFRIRHGGEGPLIVSDVAVNGPTAGLLEPGDEIVSVDSLVAGDVHIRQLLKHLRLARDEVTLVIKKNYKNQPGQRVSPQRNSASSYTSNFETNHCDRVSLPRLTSNRPPMMIQSAGPTTASNGFPGGGAIPDGRKTDSNQNNHHIGESGRLKDENSLISSLQQPPQQQQTSHTGMMTKSRPSNTNERKKLAEAFIMTGDAIIITKSLESSGEELKSSSPEDEDHSEASRVTLSKHTNATTGECTSDLVSAFGSEELGAGFSDFDMSIANTISPSEDFSRDDDWLEPELGEVRHSAIDGQSSSGNKMHRSTSRYSNCSSSRVQQTKTTTVTTSASWQRRSMDESSLSFFKEEIYSEEKRVIPLHEDDALKEAPLPPPPVPTVSPPSSPDEAEHSAISPLVLPLPSQTKTSVDVPSALRLAKRLYNLEGFRKVDVSHHLSKNNDFSRCVADEYLRHFNFSGLSLDAALRLFLDKFCLQGETQERERVLVHFSKRYLDCNPDCPLSSQDAIHTLTCALMLLNTDLHGPGLSRRRMTVQDFAQNLSGLNDGKDFPKDHLRHLFQAIKEQPIRWASDFEPAQRMESSAFSGGISSGGQESSSLARDFRKGYLVRKCCLDPGGRRTPRGKRSWKTLYAKLSDLLLLLHKDEKSCEEMKSLTDSMQHTTPVHHCLATVATDYAKRSWVFRLQTADLAEFLFQAVSEEDCLQWVETINCVAAALSAPALAAPTSSSAKFQRPTLPISHSRLKPQEQLESHYARVLCLERELHELASGSSPSHPTSNANASSEKRKEAKHDKHDKERSERLAVKEAFLTYELQRYNTYATLLSKAIRQGSLIVSPKSASNNSAAGNHQHLSSGAGCNNVRASQQSPPSQKCHILRE